ncbi:HNH endonuclease signature motif containing protein [Trinickia sp. YCB016]
MAQAPTSSASLDEQGHRLLWFLVAWLPNVKPDDPRTFVSYKEIHDALGLHQQGPTYGESLKQQGLNSLAEWSMTTGKPGITGLIIDKTTLMPGDGYFKLFGRKPDDFGWWRSEIERSKIFPWESYLTGDDVASEAVSGEGWSKDELRASVMAYIEMQRLDRAGTHFSKRKYYDDLAAKFGRTAKSFEYRMQNISYVLALMGRDWLSGLKPAKNVGANVAAQIEELIAEVEEKSITPVVAFEIAVRENVKKKQLTLPQGSRVPKAVTLSVTQYQRDASVKAWVLRQANGICECCSQQAPFSGSDGLPYLEVHHVRKLAEKGSDSTENAVAACPNCHRELHYGENAKDLVERLYKNIPRLRRE